MRKLYWPGQIVEYPEFVRGRYTGDWPVRFLVLEVKDDYISVLGRDGKKETVHFNNFLPMPVKP